MNAFCIVIVLALGIAAGRDVGQQTFRTSADVVVFPVTVVGRGNNLVRGLTREEFSVFEDGKRQEVTFFNEGAGGPALPLHLGLLLDTSSSMDRDLAAAVTAAIRFVNAVDESVDVTFVDFATEVRVSRFSPPSYAHLFERMRSNKAEGSTALYDALGLYLTAAERQDGQKVLLLYTDGEDSTSSLGYGRMIEMLRLSDVMVYAIGYLDGLRNRGTAQLRLNDVAHQTGGEAFFPVDKKQLDEIYAKIEEEIASRYSLGFISTNRTADGKWRKVEVQVTAAAGKGARLRTRPGYFAPAR